MTLGCGDGNATARLALEGVVRVDQNLQLPIVRSRQLGTKDLEVAFDFRDARANGSFRMSRTRLAPVEIALISRITYDCITDLFKFVHFAGTPSDRRRRRND